MLEKKIEAHLKKRVEAIGGRSYKFVSPSARGVADRIVMLPDGSTHFVELKTAGGRLSALQIVFANECERLKQNYRVLWSTEDIDAFIKTVSGTVR
jgi:hypothetical protein